MKKQPNEETIYENVIENGFVREGNPSFSELLALAKYIRQTEGYGEKNIIKWLVEFCRKDDEFFNPVTSSGLLDSVTKAAIKDSKWRKLNLPMVIVQDEIDAIRKIKNFKLQNILLAVMVIAKSTGNPKILSDAPNQIYHIIEVSGQTYSNKLFLEELSPIAHSKKIFTFVANKYQFYALTCDNGGDVVIEINNEDDYYNLSEIYRKFVGGKLGWCKDCKSEYIVEGSNHSYCKKCSKIREKERNRDRRNKV